MRNSYHKSELLVELSSGVLIFRYKTTDKPYPRGEVLVKTQAGAVGFVFSDYLACRDTFRLIIHFWV